MGRESRTVGEIVRERRRARGLTLQDVADRVGCTKGYLSSIENGRSLPGAELRGVIESALGFEAGELGRAAAWQTAPADVRHEVERLRRQQAIGRELAELIAGGGRAGPDGECPGAEAGEGAHAPGVSLDELYRSGRLRALVDRLTGAPDRPRGATGEGIEQTHLPLEIPLINSVRAGYPTEFTDLGYPARVADEYVRSPDIRDPDAFAARVVGDSMSPEYREGDIVIFSPARDVRAGDDCFARLEPDHETTFKRVYFEGDPGSERIRLQPLNPSYAPAVFEREAVVGLYPAVSVLRDLTSR